MGRFSGALTLELLRKNRREIKSGSSAEMWELKLHPVTQ